MLRRFSINKVILTAAFGLVFCVSYALLSAQAKDQDNVVKPDEWQLCDQLWSQLHLYGKSEWNVDHGAACDFIASKGWDIGYRKVVLDELGNADKKYGNDVRLRVKSDCLRILGCMLARDAIERDNKYGQKVHSAQHDVSPDIVPGLLNLAKSAKENTERDAYLSALVRARDKRCQEFFMEALNGPNHTISERFHAADGLAGIGNPDGVKWLIAHCEDRSRTVIGYVSERQNEPLDISCILTLRSLSQKDNLITRAEFENWWNKSDKKFVLSPSMTPTYR